MKGRKPPAASQDAAAAAAGLAGKDEGTEF